ncbi:MAG: hypothetical protein JOY53_14885 [Acidobacteriaceae bacterium]|nr:hypothetical protein [Acidobacteriaceae bacterium]
MHAVVSGPTAPDRMLSDFKAYATRSLRRNLSNLRRQRYWAHHGSTRYLWNQAGLIAAIEFVLNDQGKPMACYAHETEPEA